MVVRDECYVFVKLTFRASIPDSDGEVLCVER